MPRSDEIETSVKREIQDSVQTYWKWSRIHDRVSAWIVFWAILTSFLAGIVAAGKFAAPGYEWVVAIIAGMPALLLSLERSFKFQARADWFWTMVIHYQELERQIARGELDYETASRRISEIEAGGIKTFPKTTAPG